jgi:hypothetical protein
MQTKLRPRQHFAKLVQRPESARQSNEGIRQFGHQRLALVHRADDMEFRQTLVTDLPCHEVFGDDSYPLAACFQSGVRDYPHETHIPASVHQANASSHQFRSHLLSGNGVFRTATFTGAAENADSFHAGILISIPLR